MEIIHFDLVTMHDSTERRKVYFQLQSTHNCLHRTFVAPVRHFKDGYSALVRSMRDMLGRVKVVNRLCRDQSEGFRIFNYKMLCCSSFWLESQMSFTCATSSWAPLLAYTEDLHYYNWVRAPESELRQKKLKNPQNMFKMSESFSLSFFVQTYQGGGKK